MRPSHETITRSRRTFVESARHLQHGLAFVVAIVLVLGLAVPAHARIVERDRYEYTYEDVYDFCGFDIEIEGSLTGQFHAREGKGPNAPVLFTHRLESWQELWSANGRTLTFTAKALSVRTSASRVEPGSSIFLIDRISAGHGTFRDDSGAVVVREAGVWRFSFLWDTATNEFVETVSIEARGLWPEVDLCAFFE